MLRPKPPNARIDCPAAAPPLRAGDVIDRRGYQDRANVGFTQTGMSNVKASLRTDPPPAGLVKARLENVLRSCKVAPGGQPARVDVLITRFQTTEESGFATESISAEVSLTVRVLSADDRPLGTFDVSAEAEESSAIDTTDYADDVIERALEKSEELLARGLVNLARTIPVHAASASATVAGTHAVPMTTRIQAVARYMNAETEDDIFDERLIDSGLVPIELELTLKGQGDPISLRRDGISASFGSTSITALDSRKTQELVQHFAAMVPFGYGPNNYAIARAGDQAISKDARGRATDEVVHMTTVGDKLEGLVFFQSPRTPRGAPESLTIELIESHTGRVEKVQVRIAPAGPAPDDD